jgi:hypothetical protein
VQWSRGVDQGDLSHERDPDGKGNALKIAKYFWTEFFVAPLGQVRRSNRRYSGL